MGRAARETTPSNEKPLTRRKGKANHKKPWTQKEDKLLLKLIEKYGPSRWSAIARSIPSRQGKQCRERWYNHLSPDIRKGNWEVR